VLAKDLVEVFDLALDGLWADEPSAGVFRKRIGVLVKQFTAASGAMGRAVQPRDRRGHGSRDRRRRASML